MCVSPHVGGLGTSLVLVMNSDLISGSQPDPNLILSRFYKWIGMACVLCLTVMVLGSYVRATDSGLACPDWPLCYGKLVPSFDFGIFLEWFHRLLAASLGLVLLFLTYQVWRSTFLRKALAIPLLISAVVFLVQVVLGGLTVLKLLQPSIVSLHLLNGLVFYSLLLWMWYRVGLFTRELLPSIDAGRGRVLFLGFRVLVSLLLLQVLLGGSLSSNYGGLVCPDFPTCYGSWWPEWPGFLAKLNMSHRYMAGLLLLCGLVVARLGWSRRQEAPIASKIALSLPFLIMIQICVGIGAVLWRLPDGLSALHLFVALSIFSVAFLGSLEVHYGMQIARGAWRPMGRSEQSKDTANYSGVSRRPSERMS